MAWMLAATLVSARSIAWRCCVLAFVAVACDVPEIDVVADVIYAQSDGLCAQRADCDDGVSCTIDHCADQACNHTPSHSRCAPGRCEPGQPNADLVTGCTPEPCNANSCVGASCTEARCVDGICLTTPLCDVGEQCCDRVCGVDCGAPHACLGRSAGSVCRPAAGGCDQPELCDGASADCPPDVLKPAQTPCRPAVGGCDVADSCDGVSPSCVDVVRPSTYECEPAGSCTAASMCTGASHACPGAVSLPNNTSCGFEVTCCNGQCQAPGCGGGGDGGDGDGT